eukprot:TRINITY_DN6658_c1_g1_i4.p1 TRINITY_DN6658_c1_g1~~TRINITY_DN6658_c1_g1_i4.p1  ORF type:complete len:280 (+),score=14.21 TRINITY_DN6658_c1_g1_i4:36-875(+)
MLRHFDDHRYSGVRRSSLARRLTDDPRTKSKTDNFGLARKDAKRAMNEDPSLEQEEISSLAEDEMATQVYFHRDNWDDFELQALSQEMIAETNDSSFYHSRSWQGTDMLYSKYKFEEADIKMQVKIQTRGFNLSPALNDYTDTKVRLTLGLYREKIKRVDVFLSDVNGPKGGEDMMCKIVIKANGCHSIIVQDIAEDMYDAINICAHRIKRAVGRRFDRATQRRKAHTSALFPVQAFSRSFLLSGAQTCSLKICYLNQRQIQRNALCFRNSRKAEVKRW